MHLICCITGRGKLSRWKPKSSSEKRKRSLSLRLFFFLISNVQKEKKNYMNAFKLFKTPYQPDGTHKLIDRYESVDTFG